MDDTLQQLKKEYNAACNAYLAELLNMWELDTYYGFWNSDQPGTIYHYGDTHNLTMEDIIYIVENEIKENEVMEWEEYLLDAHEFGFITPNLRSWHEGCPRQPRKVFDTLRRMKADFEHAVEQAKKHPVNQF